MRIPLWLLDNNVIEPYFVLYKNSLICLLIVPWIKKHVYNLSGIMTKYTTKRKNSTKSSRIGFFNWRNNNIKKVLIPLSNMH